MQLLASPKPDCLVPPYTRGRRKVRKVKEAVLLGQSSCVLLPVSSILTFLVITSNPQRARGLHYHSCSSRGSAGEGAQSCSLWWFSEWWPGGGQVLERVVLPETSVHYSMHNMPPLECGVTYISVLLQNGAKPSEPPRVHRPTDLIRPKSRSLQGGIAAPHAVLPRRTKALLSARLRRRVRGRQAKVTPGYHDDHSSPTQQKRNQVIRAIAN